MWGSMALVADNALDLMPWSWRRSLIFKPGYTCAAIDIMSFSNFYRGLQADPDTGNVKVTNELLADISMQSTVDTIHMINDQKIDPETGEALETSFPYGKIHYEEPYPTFNS